MPVLKAIGARDIEREINGVTAEERLAARRSRSAPLVAALEEWTRSERAKLSRHNAVAKAIDYMLTAGRLSRGSSKTDASA